MSEAALKTIPNEAPAVPMVAPSASVTPMDMLDRAVASGASLEMIDKLMGLQERWERNNNRKEFDAAVSAAKAEIPSIIRNATGHNSKRYADFAGIASVVDPILARHGLGYRFRTSQTERISVTCILFHRAGHYEETTLTGPADQTGNKNAIQAIGSTQTYLQRYTLVAMLGLAAAADDDGKVAGVGEKINEEQVEVIRSLIVETGSDIQKFCKFVKIDKIEDMPLAKFERAKSALEAKRTQD